MNICVYGASSNDIDEKYIKSGEALGEMMASRGHNLVFGAGNGGLMGAVARGEYKGNGKIVGVAPKFFNVDGLIFPHCDELIRPDTMRERKQIMEDRSDAFIVTPGGIGTFEEFFEILTLKQLMRHNKPIAVLNTGGYYDSMLDFIENAISQGFLKEKARLLYLFADKPEEVLDYIGNYKTESIDINELKNIN